MRFITCLALIVCFFVADEILAQRRGGSFGGSRSSSRSFSSPSPSSRPSSSFGGSRSSGSSFGGSRSNSYSSPSAPSRSYSTPSSGGGFGGSRSTAVSRSSGSSAPRSYGIPRKESYGGQTYSYKGSSGSVGYNRSSAMIPRRSYSYNNVYTTRNSYYSGMGYVAPSYIGYTSPSYGMFSTLFMLSALSNLQAQHNAMFYYNHWNTPSMMAYRQDLQVAAQKDAEAAQRLKELEAKVAQLEKEKGGVRDTTYMPQGVDSSVVLSNEALGVKDDPEEARVKAEAERLEREERLKEEREKKSSGSGWLWFVLIGGGAGTWWFLRRRKQQRESGYGGGSFS